MTVVEAELLIEFFTKTLSPVRSDIRRLQDIWYEATLTEKTIVQNAVNKIKYGRTR